jgi:hypothetical protein
MALAYMATRACGWRHEWAVVDAAKPVEAWARLRVTVDEPRAGHRTDACGAMADSGYDVSAYVRLPELCEIDGDGLSRRDWIEVGRVVIPDLLDRHGTMLGICSKLHARAYTRAYERSGACRVRVIAGSLADAERPIRWHKTGEQDYEDDQVILIRKT